MAEAVHQNGAFQSVTKTEETLLDQSLEKPLSDSWRQEPLSLEESDKVTKIIKASHGKDVATLSELARTHGGFVEDEMRRRAWPILLGCDSQTEATDWTKLPQHRDEGQVQLDVNRAFVYYPQHESQKKLEDRKEEPSNLITATLRRHPSLYYFQGYHDIAQVLLLVLGAHDAEPALVRLSLLHIRDFMLPTMSGTSSHLELLPPVLYAADPGLCKQLSGLQPFFALAATLTMFAHDIEEYGGIARLFDFLLSREAVISVYMFAVIVMLRKDELLEIGADEPEMMYAILSKLPKPLDLDSLIRRAVDLFERYPPETLPFGAWRKVSKYSVLKTTRDRTALQAQRLGDGEMWLQKQGDEIERAEARKKMIQKARLLLHRYRRPAGALTIAVFIGLISVWLGRNGTATSTGLPGLLSWTRQHIPYTMQRALGNLLA